MNASIKITDNWINLETKNETNCVKKLVDWPNKALDINLKNRNHLIAVIYLLRLMNLVTHSSVMNFTAYWRITISFILIAYWKYLMKKHPSIFLAFEGKCDLTIRLPFNTAK